jgi:murein tripeptide amidase MpaA
MYFAYFEPYSYELHLDLLASASQSPHVTLERLGGTLDGRDMTLLRITDSAGTLPVAERKRVWLIARQHPGETMAEWFIEGFLERLLDTDDAVSRVLLQRCVFYLVPNMNPDGAVRGNLRTNAAGANLNREWAEPTLERSPEVYLVRQRMLDIGVDLNLDVHGDEALPYNFVVGSEGNPGYTPQIAALEDAFKNAWMANCPEFQDQYNYGRSEPGTANPTLATNWIAQQFGCLALTIEMPFKDNAQLPDAATGWSGVRSKRLGASVLQPLLAVLCSRCCYIKHSCLRLFNKGRRLISLKSSQTAHVISVHWFPGAACGASQTVSCLLIGRMGGSVGFCAVSQRRCSRTCVGQAGGRYLAQCTPGGAFGGAPGVCRPECAGL